MIVNFEGVIEAIKSEITEIESLPDCQDTESWGNIVYGLQKAINAASDYKERSSFHMALSGLSRVQLEGIKECADSKIRMIDEGRKVKIFRVAGAKECLYFDSFKKAKSSMLYAIASLSEEELDKCELEIKPLLVPESELADYGLGGEC